MSVCRWIPIVAPPLAFAALGAMSRWTFRFTETRLQMLGFVILAAFVELAINARGDPPSRVRFLACALAAVTAILGVRLYLEGPPHLVMAWISSIRR